MLGQPPLHVIEDGLVRVDAAAAGDADEVAGQLHHAVEVVSGELPDVSGIPVVGHARAPRFRTTSNASICSIVSIRRAAAYACRP